MENVCSRMCVLKEWICPNFGWKDLEASEKKNKKTIEMIQILLVGMCVALFI